MPPLPSVDKVLKVDYVHQYGEDIDVLSRNFWLYTGTTPTDAELATSAAAFGALWLTYFAPLCNAEAITLESINVTDLSSPTGAYGEAALGTAGSRAGAFLTADACAVTAYEISRRYRGGHPRGYWPFGSAPDIESPQQWTDGFVTDVEDAMAAWQTDSGAEGWSGSGTLAQVNVSYYSGFTAVENPLTHRYRNIPTVRATPITDFVANGIICRQRVGSQRRRLGRA